MFITSVTVITAITVITKRKEKSVLFGCGFDFSRTISGGEPGRRRRFWERAFGRRAARLAGVSRQYYRMLIRDHAACRRSIFSVVREHRFNAPRGVNVNGDGGYQVGAECDDVWFADPLCLLFRSRRAAVSRARDRFRPEADKANGAGVTTACPPASRMRRALRLHPC